MSSLIAVKIADSLLSQDNCKYKNHVGIYVNDCSFYSHLSGAACPDHLFKGLITNIFTVCFDFLPDNNIRSHVDILVCAAVCDHKLPSIDMILSWDKHGKYNGINNMKTSSMFCALLFAEPIFDMIQGITTTQSSKDQASGRTGDHDEIASDEDITPQSSNDNAIATTTNNRGSASTSQIPLTNTLYNCIFSTQDTPTPYHLPHLLQQVIGLVYWWPQVTTDTTSDVEYVKGSEFNRTKQLKYFGDIQMKCKKYTGSINHYCFSGGKGARVLDKPNAHRLLELAYHTIPMYGHALNISELVLEQVHRNFKEWLEKNTHDDAHITAVEIALSKDWGMRAFALYKLWEGGTTEEKKAAEFGLRRLMLGSTSLHLSTESDVGKTELEKFKNRIKDAFACPVEEEMRGNRQFPLLQKKNERWMVEKCCEEPTDVQSLQAVKMLEDFINHTQPNVQVDLEFFAIAKHMRKGRFQQYRPTNPVNSI